MRNEEVVEKIQKYHEKRIETLEAHVATLNREMGQVLAAIDSNKFWLRFIGLGTPGTIIGLWALEKLWDRVLG